MIYFFLLSLPIFGTPSHPKLFPVTQERTPLQSPNPPSVTVYGYHAYWTGNALDIDLSPLTHIAVFNVDLNADGTLSDTHNWTNVAQDLVPKAHNIGVKVHLCLTSFSDSINNVVLPSATKRATLVQELSDLINDYGADGVNIDIEGMDAAQRENLNLLVDELSPHVDEIFLATPAIDWSDAYDYEYLAEHSDGLFIMGYGYHWKGGDPGPVDPLYGGSPWFAYSLEWTVDDYRDKGVPDDKIILGLPLYGRQWPTASSTIPGTATGDGVAFVMGEALSYGSQMGSDYDSVTHTPYVLENDKQLWYPDVDSVRSRISWAVEEQLQGIGFWALDYELGADGFWDMVQEETVLVPPTEPSSEPTNEPTNEPSGETSNSKPIADAGIDMVTEIDTITLDGSGSTDPDGDSLSYEWTQLHGPSAQINTATNTQTQVVLSQEGTYRFSLLVSDDAQEAQDAITVIYETNAKTGCATQNRSSWFSLLSLLLIGRRRNKTHSS
ncbi:MAG: hypothetical protein CL916_11635 [Deltaproteobacteria bacterium]|nr:hypothetical protein [Deltaproteobacteria bacterium]